MIDGSANECPEEQGDRIPPPLPPPLPPPPTFNKLKTQPYFLGGDLVQHKHTVPLIRLDIQNMDLIQYLLYNN